MIYVGIDDTDMPGTPGTNQLARALVARLADRCEPVRITRHQLLSDPRVPCTSKNGSASILLRPRNDERAGTLVPELRAGMRDWFVPGSDPGLCAADAVPEAIIAFGRRCQSALVHQAEARELAAAHGLHLEGLGGTEGGVIGALAAVGLAACADDGRVVQLGDWPDDLAGPQDVARIRERGIDVRTIGGGEHVPGGRVDVGKHLRPNVRAGQVVLFVAPVPADGDTTCWWQAVRLP